MSSTASTVKSPSALKAHHRKLVGRYLLWAYKTTRESFERIERKTTQLLVDEYILGYFAAHKLRVPAEFRAYIAQKRKDELKLRQDPQYVYLQNRMRAIEAAVRHFLGPKEPARMQALYEEEFTRRILEAREH
ncbi:MAG: hypothetical protein KGJ09_06835 [Candidatus Omnitrophica bacterium]|nr:hypothetical protein [Candidatus Omnitrophota bacterium]MDE2009780.1 hypothetical protein [Candidatus Omnitrophota bacterium]MDE2215125.1 hypothetical protein [Candidatus Omnitrophota bacterium]MDE2231479.1 hypothetical protein [Candidatus Omnitrophota bacterium]